MTFVILSNNRGKIWCVEFCQTTVPKPDKLKSVKPQRQNLVLSQPYLMLRTCRSDPVLMCLTCSSSKTGRGDKQTSLIFLNWSSFHSFLADDCKHFLKNCFVRSSNVSVASKIKKYRKWGLWHWNRNRFYNSRIMGVYETGKM